MAELQQLGLDSVDRSVIGRESACGGELREAKPAAAAAASNLLHQSINKTRRHHHHLFGQA